MLDKAVADRIVLDYKVQFGHFVIVKKFYYKYFYFSAYKNEI